MTLAQKLSKRIQYATDDLKEHQILSTLPNFGRKKKRRLRHHLEKDYTTEDMLYRYLMLKEKE